MRPELHSSLFDSWMLSNFPGRTLEELDTMDILRYMRAMDARAIESRERLKADIFKKKIKATDVSKEDYEIILENDKLWEAYQREHIDKFLEENKTWQI